MNQHKPTQARYSNLRMSSATLGAALSLLALLALPPFRSVAQRSGYAVQVASLTTVEEAEARVRQLKEKGLAAYWIKSEVPGQGTRMRVRVGHYASEAQARQACVQMRQKLLVTECYTAPYEAPAASTTTAAASLPAQPKTTPVAQPPGPRPATNTPAANPPVATPTPTVRPTTTQTQAAPVTTTNQAAPASAPAPTPAPIVQAQRANEPIRVAVFKPEVKTGSLTPVAFMSRLLPELEKETGFSIGSIDLVIERDKVRQMAANDGYDFILFTSISGVEDKSLGGKTGSGLKGAVKKLPGMKNKVEADLRFKVIADYELEAVATRQQVLKEHAESNERNVEESVAKVIEKLVRDVTGRARQVVATLPPKPVAAVTPGASAAPTPRSVSSAPRLVVQTTHSTMVTDFAYSPDGKLLVTLSSDGIVKLWNSETRIELNTFSGYRTVGIAFSPDGKVIAALGKDGVVRLFDVASGRMRHRLTEINRSKPKREKDSGDLFNTPVPVAFGPAGKLVVNGGEDGLRVWDAVSGRRLHTLLKDKQVPQLAVSPDGVHIAAVIDENRIKLIATADGRDVKTFHSKVGKITALVFSQDGQKLMIGSRYGTVRIFNAVKGEEEGQPPVYNSCDKPFEAEAKAGILGRVPVVKGTARMVGDYCEIAKDLGNLMNGRLTIFYETSIRSMALHPSGNLLAWSLGDNTVRVTDIRDRQERYNIPAESKARQSGPRNVSPALVVAEFFNQLAPVKFSTDGKTLNSVREFKTVGRWDANTGEQVFSLAVAKRDLSGGFPFPMPWGSVPVFGKKGDTMVTGSLSKGTKLWDLKDGTAPMQVTNSPSTGNKLPISPDAKLMVEILPDGKDLKKVVIRDIISRLEVKNFQVKCVAAEPEFSPDGKYLALRTYERGRFLADSAWLRVYEIASGQLAYSRKHTSHFQFSNDGKLLALRLDKDESLRLPFTSRKDDLRVVRVGTWEEIFKEKAEDSESGAFSSRVVFNTDATLLASVDFYTIKVWDVATGKPIAQRELAANEDLSNLIFKPHSKILTYTMYRTLNHWDLEAKPGANPVKVSTLLTDYWGNLDYSADGKLLALGGAENRIRLFEVENDNEVGSLVVPSQNDWLVITPTGQLDTSRLEQVEEVHWVLGDEPYAAQPLELFMRDFYEPRLLARLAAGDSFVEVGDLSSRNRTLPEVTITNIASEAADIVRVTVQVKNAFSLTQFDTQRRQYQSGAVDLRLFRDDQLVGYVEGQVLPQGAGEASRTFTVRLPHTVGKERFELTAYAFNTDNVKSVTAKRDYEPPTPLPPRKGKVYLVSIGVNASESPQFNLRYAASDALLTQSALAGRLRATNRYASVVEVPLISDQKQTNATKAMIKAVVDLLAGRRAQVPADLLRRIPNAPQLERVTPDDLVLISYAGHGYTDQKGVFYFIPSDIGAGAKGLAEILNRCISSTDLSLWLRDVDAGEVLMIVDACYSEAAIKSKDFKPGPMGSRGLGQLSYDKGMRILTATQADNVALEVERLGQGLLTYALLKDGLENSAADFRPVDKRIMTTEWLGFGVKRVPELYDDVRSGKLRLLENGSPVTKERADLVFAGIKKTTQQPALFDFSLRRKDAEFLSLQ
jgi:WD40 repeat protein